MKKPWMVSVHCLLQYLLLQLAQKFTRATLNILHTNYLRNSLRKQMFSHSEAQCNAIQRLLPIDKVRLVVTRFQAALPFWALCPGDHPLGCLAPFPQTGKPPSSQEVPCCLPLLSGDLDAVRGFPTCNPVPPVVISIFFLDQPHIPQATGLFSLLPPPFLPLPVSLSPSSSQCTEEWLLCTERRWSRKGIEI